MIKKLFFLTTLFVLTNLSFAAKPNIKIENGHLKQGGFVVINIGIGNRAEFKERKLKADGAGIVLIGFSRDEELKQSLTVITQDGQKFQYPLTIQKREYNVQRINGLPKNKVTPDKKTQDQIWQDILKAKAARKINLPDPYFETGFIWPSKGIISGVYGSQRVLNGKPRRPHFGVDIAAPQGTPVYAPADGKITLTANMVLSGNTVMIDHGYGLRSTMMHLYKIHVKQDELVKKGQLVGEIGTTGRSTGPHLHWGMSWFNVRLDPALAVTDSLKLGDKVTNPK